MLIFLTPILVILSSTAWYYSGASLPEGRVNNGQLLSPPIDVGELGGLLMSINLLTLKPSKEIG